MRIFKWFLLLLYIVFLIYIVFLMPRRQELLWSEQLINLVPVQHTVLWFQSLEYTPSLNWLDFFSNFFGNIAMFVPLPFFLKEVFSVTNKGNIIGAGVILSCLIEVLQLLWRIGVPDIDDVILNTTGVLVGVYAWNALLQEMIYKKRSRYIP